MTPPRSRFEPSVEPAILDTQPPLKSADPAPSAEADELDTAGPDQRHEDRRSKLDRRRGPGRRRTDYRRAAEEGHMNEEQVDFLRAIDEYKRVNHRPFPTWTEILDLVLYLGYRRVAPVGEFKLTKGRQTPLPGQSQATPDADPASE